MRRRRADDAVFLARLVREYFDWSITERRLSPRTVHSYRDAMVLFLRHLADTGGRGVEELVFPEDLSAHVLAFLRAIETERGVSASTRNHRLSVIKSFCRFVAYREPLLATACRRVSAMQPKKHEEKLLDFFEPSEMEAIIEAASPTSADGVRNRALLLLLYNTGCRASELAGLTVADLVLDRRPRHVRILGKGQRWRTVPLWDRTVVAIQQMLSGRSERPGPLFLGQRGNSITRYGVRYVVRHYGREVAATQPELAKKRVSPHTVRHTTAVALLRATGDIDAVSKVLGHASLNTTRVYTGKDRSRIAATLNQISKDMVPDGATTWRPREDLLGWLERL